MLSTTRSIQYQQVRLGQSQKQTGEAIVEAPVTLTVNGIIWLTLMCTPADLDALAAGFLFNEGVISSRAEIADLRVCPMLDNVDIWLTRSVRRPEHWGRISGCTGGMTRAEILDQYSSGLPTVPPGGAVEARQISQLIVQLFEAQELYKQSGGVHTSAMSDGERLWVVAEDVGRHNTLDKIAGRLLLEDLEPSPRLILTTGRISSDMLQKSAKMGASIVVSRTAPTSLSIELAERCGVTLIGYARRDRFNLYTHPERILMDEIR